MVLSSALHPLLALINTSFVLLGHTPERQRRLWCLNVLSSGSIPIAAVSRLSKKLNEDQASSDEVSNPKVPN